MGIVVEGEYYKHSRDAGPHVPPSFPSKKYTENYDQIQWDKPSDKEDNKWERKKKQDKQ